MNKPKIGKKISSLALGSSMLVMSLLPAASAFAATTPSVTLIGSSLTANVGGHVNFVASAHNVSNPEYQFWVETPSGKWIVGQNYSSNNSFTLSNVQNGDYLVNVDVLSASQVKAGQWSKAVNTLSKGVFVNSSVKVSGPSGTIQKGQKVTINAAASNIYSPLYQFWYQTPSGTWMQSGTYSSNNSYTFTATETGSYKFTAYAKSPMAVNNYTGALSAPAVTKTIHRDVTGVTVSGTNSFAAGSSATLTAVATNNGVAVSNPADVKWTVTSSNGNASNVTFGSPMSAKTSFNVPSSDPGTYTVTATVNGVASKSYTINAYGQAAAVKLSPSSSKLVADGKATDTITATVVDSNGNPVKSFNGTATIANGNTSAASTNISTSGQTQNADLSGTTLTFKNGQAQFLVQAGTTAGLTDKFTPSALATSNGSVSGMTYKSGSINTTSQVATAVTEKASSQYIADNSNGTSSNGGQATFTAQVVDQKGFPMLSGSYPIVFSQSGPATSSSTTNTAFVAGSSAPTYVVDAEKGQLGSVNVTATSSGLPYDMVTKSVQAVTVGSPAQVVLADSTPTFAAGSTSGTTVKASFIDSHGYPVSSGDTLSYTLTQNGKSVSSTDASVSQSGNSFTVTGTKAGTYTLTVKDATTSGVKSASTNVTIQAAAPSQVVETSPAGSTEVASGNPSLGITAQVEDQYGNPVNMAGIPVTFTVGGNGTGDSAEASLGHKTVNTGSNGQASTTMTSEPYVGNKYQVGVAGTYNGTSLSSGSISSMPVISVVNTVATSVSGTLTDKSTTSTSQATAGDSLTLALGSKDQYGNSVSGDTYSLSLNGIKASSLPSGVTLHSNGTLTGTATALEGVTYTAEKAGTDSVTITDTTAPTKPSTTVSINTVAGPQVGYALFDANGQRLTHNVSNQYEDFSAGTPAEVWLKPVDAEGNPVTVASQTAQQVDINGSGGVFRNSASGADISDVILQPGSSGAALYFVNNGSSATYTDLTAGAAVASATTGSVANATPTAGSATTATVKVLDQNGNVDTNYTGTHKVTISGYKPSPNGSYGSFAGTKLSGSSTTVSLSFTKGVATGSVTLDDAAAQGLTFTASGNTSSSVTVTPNPAALASYKVTSPTSTTIAVTADDKYGNVQTSTTSAYVNYTALDGTAGATTFTAGTLKTASGNTTITANGSGQPDAITLSKGTATLAYTPSKDTGSTSPDPNVTDTISAQSKGGSITSNTFTNSGL